MIASTGFLQLAWILKKEACRMIKSIVHAFCHVKDMAEFRRHSTGALMRSCQEAPQGTHREVIMSEYVGFDVSEEKGTVPDRFLDSVVQQMPTHQNYTINLQFAYCGLGLS